jgi:hypothetical protein
VAPCRQLHSATHAGQCANHMLGIPTLLTCQWDAGEEQQGTPCVCLSLLLHGHIHCVVHTASCDGAVGIRMRHWLSISSAGSCASVPHLRQHMHARAHVCKAAMWLSAAAMCGCWVPGFMFRVAQLCDLPFAALAVSCLLLERGCVPLVPCEPCGGVLVPEWHVTEDLNETGINVW